MRVLHPVHVVSTRRAGRYFSGALTVGATLISVGSARAQQPAVRNVRTLPPGTGKQMASVQSCFGRVELERAAVSALKLLEKDALFHRDTILTAQDARTLLSFEEGSRVEMAAGSRLELDSKFLPEKGRGVESLFRLVRGRVLVRARPGLQVETQSGITAVRGTIFQLSVSDDDQTRLIVIQGAADLFNKFGRVRVNAGQLSTVRPGEAPTPPVTFDLAGIQVEWTPDLRRTLVAREVAFKTLSRRQANEEVARLTPLVAQNQANVGLRQTLGEALLDGGQPEAALEAFTAAQNLLPGDIQLTLRRAFALTELSRLDEAQAAYSEVLNTIPAPTASLLVQANVELAWLSLRRDQPEIAEQNARTALALLPPNPVIPVSAEENLVTRPRLILTGWDIDPATAPQLVATQDEIAPPGRASTISPEAASIHLVLGVALARKGDKFYDAAREELNKAANSDWPGQYQAYAWLSSLDLTIGQAEDALSQAQKAVELNPQSALAQSYLAQARLAVNDFEGAEIAARRALEIRPDTLAAQVALAQVRLVRGDADGAALMAARAVAMDDQQPVAHYVLGLADIGRRDYSHATESLQEALKLAPGYVPAASALGRVYLRQNRRHEARALLDTMREQNPDNSEVQAALGEAYYAQGDYAVALKLFKAALAKRESALSYAGAARVALDANQLALAIEYSQKAVALAPSVGQYQALLGLSYYLGDLNAQSQRALRSALALDPQNALARVVLAVSAPDNNTAAANAVQAFLYDPAVSRQLFKGGTRHELTGTVASDGYELGLTQATYGDQGRFNSYGQYQFREDTHQTDRDNSTVLQYLAYQASPRTQLFVDIEDLRRDRRLQGPSNSPLGPDPDDTARRRGNTGVVALRHRLDTGKHLWMGAVYQNSKDQRYAVRDSFPPGLFSSRIVRFENMALEARADFALGLGRQRAERRAPVLTVGAELGDLESDQSLESIKLGNSREFFEQRQSVIYAQLASEVGGSLSWVGQVRKFRLSTRSGLSGAVPPGTPESLDETLFGAAVNYRLSRRINFRLLANDRVATNTMPVALAPTETLLSGETEVLPNGSPSLTHALEADLEIYSGSGDLLKLFAFRSTASDLLLGGNALDSVFPPSLLIPKVRRYGGGIRYDRQLGGELYGSFLFAVNRTHAQAPGTSYDNGIAPYQPYTLAVGTLDYLGRHGHKIRLRVRRDGAFYRDTPTLGGGRPISDASWSADLGLAYEPSVEAEYFVNWTNIFNTRQIDFNSFPVNQRRLVVGVTARY